MKVNLLIILIVFSLESCLGRTDKKLISNWNTHPIPTNPDSLRKYGFSFHEWAVYKKNDSVFVVDKKELPSPQLPFKIKVKKADSRDFGGRASILKVEDGYLVGFYRGEWGGALYWVSSDGKNYYKISSHEIVQFINRGGKQYAIEGLAHLGTSEGSIIEIYKPNDKWAVREHLKLPTAPEAIALDHQDNFIIITSKSLLKVGRNAQIFFLVDKGLWYAALYPNSMVIRNNIIYAGMRAGVYHYDLSTGKDSWLLPY